MDSELEELLEFAARSSVVAVHALEISGVSVGTTLGVCLLVEETISCYHGRGMIHKIYLRIRRKEPHENHCPLRQVPPDARNEC